MDEADISPVILFSKASSVSKYKKVNLYFNSLILKLYNFMM